MSATALPPKTSSDLKIASDNKSRIDRVLDRTSEWFSSILVKESRQALKSRQFLWTFFGLLIVVTCWTLGAMAYVQSEFGERLSPGPYLLIGFWVILGFPMVIIIPYAAYRSLAREFDDGSLQLVLITTLKPYQIIWGKLGSSLLQIMIYISVLAPCIAFTYLLRGIDIRQIWWGLILGVSTSFGLCILALFLASCARSKQFGVAISVLFLFGLAFLYWMWCIFSYGLTYEISGFFASVNEQETLTMLAGYLLCVLSTALLLFTAAAAQVSFDADNRSSWIRLAMLIQQILFFGWVVALLCQFFEAEASQAISMTIVHYWLFMGAMMISVPAIMSRRVKRTLPKTVFGRSIMSLFAPGPGRGYLFAVANMLGWNLLLLVVMLFAPILLPEDGRSAWASPSNRVLSGDEIVEMLMVLGANCVYGITFLSALFLFLHMIIRKRPNAGPLFGLLMAVLLLLIVTLVPVYVKLQWMPYSSGEYSMLYVTHWYLTVSEITRFGPQLEGPLISVMVVGLGMLLFGYLAIRIAGRELRFLPEAIPNRVMEEEQKKRRSKELPLGESIDEILGLPHESKSHPQES